MRAEQVSPLKGRVRVPGDKSVSHRALIIGALAEGTSRFENLNKGRDVVSTADALGALGIDCRLEGTAAAVVGAGPAGLVEPGEVLDAGNSGTTLRLMAGVCSSVEGLSVLTGDDSLRTRPMRRVVDPLREMGAVIDGRSQGDRAPLAIRGGPLQGINLNLSVASAQVKSAVLLAGLAAEGPTTVREPGRSRDHTERMLEAAGATLRANGTTSRVEPGPLVPLAMNVPGDFSSGLYLVAAAALVEGSDLVLEGIGLNPTRTAALGVLRRMGVDFAASETGAEGNEPVGELRVRASAPKATEISGDEIPGLIDELPILAVLAARAEGTTVIRDAAELRVKESDRIAALVEGLRAIGADAQELPDGLVVRGPSEFSGGEVDSSGDHRIALSFAVAGLVAADRVRVKGWDVVDTSFPEFIDLLDRAGGRGG